MIHGLLEEVLAGKFSDASGLVAASGRDRDARFTQGEALTEDAAPANDAEARPGDGRSETAW